MDELEQSLAIRKNLGDQAQINALYQIRCVDCIKDDFHDGGGLFGDDSDEDLPKRKSLEDFKEQTDPMSDPLSDTIPDKNKLSKSEKSLKKPLQLF